MPPKGASMFTVTTRVAAAEFDSMLGNNMASVQVTNDSPSLDGGCSMSRGRAATPAGLPAVALLLGAFTLVRARRRRAR